MATTRWRLIVSTAVFMALPALDILMTFAWVRPIPKLIGSVCAVLLLPISFWLGDMLAGLIGLAIIQRPTDVAQTSSPTFWHVSTDPISAFGEMVDFGRARNRFLGSGFYAWLSLDGAIRFKPRRHPRTLMRFTLDPELLQQLTQQVVLRKFSWPYAKLVFHWTAPVPARFRRDPRTGSSDILIAPALWQSGRWHQVVFRNTSLVRALFETATVEYWPITRRDEAQGHTTVLQRISR